MTTDLAPSTSAATAGLTRVLFLGASLTGIALVGLAWRSVAVQLGATSAWWLPFGIALLVWPVLVLLLAFAVPVRALHALGYGVVVLYAVAIALLPLASPEHLPDDLQPWVVDMLACVCLTAAIIMPASSAWSTLALLCAVSGVVRYITDGSDDVSRALQDMLFNATTIAVFVGIVMATLAAARERDAAASRLAHDGVLRAAAEAEHLQRAQVAALLHDEVISTLIAAARSTAASAPIIRRASRRALDRVDALAVDDASGTESTVASLISALEETVSAVAPDTALRLPSAREGVLPLAVERALVGAAAEALRNSQRHAPGAGVRRCLDVILDGPLLTVVVADDGPGFDPDDVPEERYGVRYSIVDRMAGVGGEAAILSSPGEGARVELRWRSDRVTDAATPPSTEAAT